MRSKLETRRSGACTSWHGSRQTTSNYEGLDTTASKKRKKTKDLAGGSDDDKFFQSLGSLFSMCEGDDDLSVEPLPA
jgi:hypothetical protein